MELSVKIDQNGRSLNSTAANFGDRAMGLWSFLKGVTSLGSAEGTRDAMLRSYRKHRVVFADRPDLLPTDATVHEAALYGALGSRYRTLGHDATSLEAFIWLELLPFTSLDEIVGPEALAEYVVWKEPETRAEARLSWLADQVKVGMKKAFEAGREHAVAAALGREFAGHSPWVAILPDAVRYFNRAGFLLWGAEKGGSHWTRDDLEDFANWMGLRFGEEPWDGGQSGSFDQYMREYAALEVMKRRSQARGQGASGPD